MNRSKATNLLRRTLTVAAFAALGVLAMGAGDSSNQGVLKPGIVPPDNAVILFNGHGTSHWVVAGTDKPCNWKVEHGDLVDNANDIETKDKFKDFKLHLEFNEPKLGPQFKGQDRGNSGVYLQGRYELQVLDSYHNDTYADGACGAIYSIKPPAKNMAKPPGEWQTYDITFHAAKFDNGKKTEDAHVTVYWNGALVQDNTDITHSTGGGAPEADTPGPIRLQWHHHHVLFRNIWIVPEGE